MWRRVLYRTQLFDRHAEERVDDLRIELRAAAALHLATGFVDGQRRSIGTIGGHRIEGVGHGEDARPQRDALAGDGIRIARAVPALVVMTHDRRDALEERDAADDARAPGGMPLPR